MLKHHIVDSSSSTGGGSFEIWKVSVAEKETRYSTYGLYFRKSQEISEQGIIYKLSERGFEPSGLNQSKSGEMIVQPNEEEVFSYCKKIETLLAKEYPGKAVHSILESLTGAAV